MTERKGDMMKQVKKISGVVFFTLILSLFAGIFPLPAASESELLRAVFSGDIKDVNEVLNKGANVNEKDKQFGITPLHAAAYHGHTPIVRLLLRSKANIDAIDNEGETPLIAALTKGHTEIGEILVNKGAKVNIKTKNGWTPLHIAVLIGNEDLVRLLVEKGANIKAKTNEGKTPLDLAKASGKKEIAAFLENGK
jgi:ankyrin repeat protein